MSEFELPEKVAARVLKRVADTTDRDALRSEIQRQVMACTKRQLADYATRWVDLEVALEIRKRTEAAEKAAQDAYAASQEGQREAELDDAYEAACVEDRRRTYAEIDRRASERLSADLKAITEQYRRELHLEWTRELLDSPFALGDGRSVTWGDATVADHRQRAEMLEKHAAGTMESAARHHVAIDELSKSGAATLRHLVSRQELAVA